MKIKIGQLRKLIREEVQRVLHEGQEVNLTAFMNNAVEISHEDVRSMYPAAAQAMDEIAEFEFEQAYDVGEADQTIEEFTHDHWNYNTFYTNDQYSNVLISDYNDGFAGNMFVWSPDNPEWTEI